MQVRDLHDEIMAVVEEKEGPRDRRFASWIRRVELTEKELMCTFDASFEDAWGGAWIEEGAVDVGAGPAVFLARTHRGPGKRKTATYNVVLMDARGALSLTDIRAEGWWPEVALWIRDQITDLLAELSGESVPNGPVKLSEVAAETLVALEGALGLPRPDIVAVALDMYWLHVQGLSGRLSVVRDMLSEA